MKTLKKTLCLVLTVVMLVGILAVSASAKLDYKDAADVNYDEAVEVMSAIGVLKGFEDNTFLPTQNVTREQAAKIIAYLMVGSSDQADALKTTADPFSDVSKDRWSAGYIAYCAQKGIINGFEDGTFRPTETVTGLQFAKMLLCALGYGVNNEYVGNAWSINTAKDALALGIFDGNLKGANDTAATREECALYAFNTLWLNKVSYSSLLGDYITYVIGNAGKGNMLGTIAEDYKLTRTENDVQTDGLYNVYRVSGKQIVKYAVEATYTFTAKSTDKAILKAMGLSKDLTLTEYYVDDHLAGDNSTVLDWNSTTVNTLDQKNGVLLRIFAVPTTNDNGVTTTKYYAYQTNYFFAQITSKVKADSDGNYVATVKVFYPLEDGTFTTKTINNVVVGEDRVKDDYIVVNFDASEVNMGDDTTRISTVLDYINGATADAVKGIYDPKSDAAQTVTRYDNATATVTYGGTAYSYDANFATELKTGYSVGNEYDFYYDNYGYVIGNKTTADNSVLNYVYVTKADTSAADSTLLHPDAAAVAQVYFMDGSVKTVNLALTTATTSMQTKALAEGYLLDGTAVNSTTNKLEKGASYVKVMAEDGTTPVYYSLKALTNDEKNDEFITSELFSFTTNSDGEYTLSRKLVKHDGESNEQGAVLAADNLYTKKGSAYVRTVSDAGAYITQADGTTDVYAIKTTAMAVVDDGTTTSYTGYQNFPTKLWNDPNTVAIYVYTGKIVSNILFIGDIAAESKVVYGVYDGTFYNDNTGSSSVRYFNFKVDGETVAYQVEDGDNILHGLKGHIFELVLEDTTATVTDITDDEGELSNKTAWITGTVDEIHTGDQGYILVDNVAYYFTDKTACFGAVMDGTKLTYSTDYDVAVGDFVTIVYSTASTTKDNMVVVFDQGEIDARN